MSSLLGYNTVLYTGDTVQSVKLVFSTQLCELWPLQPSLLFTSHNTPPSQSQSIVYTESVCWEGVGGGGLSCVGDHILQEFTQIQNLKNCLTTPNKNLGGEGASDR
jgi:hypothetical protein